MLQCAQLWCAAVALRHRVGVGYGTARRSISAWVVVRAEACKLGGVVESDVPTFVELIKRLFETHLNPKTGRPYTPVEIVVTSHGKIAEAHARGLRDGRIKNPKRETLLALCQVFRVQPSYFFPELAKETDLTPD